LRNRKGIMAAITAAVVAYIEDEKAVMLPILRRKPVMATSSWSSSGREEIMRMRVLWQRRTVCDIWLLSRAEALSAVKKLAKGLDSSWSLLGADWILPLHFVQGQSDKERRTYS
jgi:hypothetical protein